MRQWLTFTSFSSGPLLQFLHPKVDLLLRRLTMVTVYDGTWLEPGSGDALLLSRVRRCRQGKRQEQTDCRDDETPFHE
jgi:hypothetical protein